MVVSDLLRKPAECSARGWFTQQQVWTQKIATDFIKENSCYFGGDGSRAPTGDYPKSLHSIMDPGSYFYPLSLGLSLSLSLSILSVTWPTVVLTTITQSFNR